MRTYQTIVVIDSLLKVEEIDAIIEKTLKSIENNGGKVESIDRWGKKRLAYEIKKRLYGFYVEIIFQAPNNLNKIIEREFRLDEGILRYLTIYLDKKGLSFFEKQKMKAAESKDKRDTEDKGEKVVKENGNTVVKDDVQVESTEENKDSE